MATEYIISYSIKRKRDNENDFTEIGFGNAVGENLDNCCYDLTSDVTNYRWETEGNQPEPKEVKKEATRPGFL